MDVIADYDQSMGDITIEITTSIDEDASNESIGLGDVIF